MGVAPVRSAHLAPAAPAPFQACVARNILVQSLSRYFYRKDENSFQRAQITIRGPFAPANKPEGDVMLANLKSRSALAVLVCIAASTSASGASAVTAEVAKRCDALTANAYPPRVPGNPAAGSAKGTGPAERKYYSNCVAHGGNVSAEPVPTATGEALPGAVPTDSGGRKVQRKEHDTYKPCPASVAIHGRNLCLGLK
jgi:hypothetical protein